MAKRNETLTIPIHLVKMLIAEREDVKNPEQYEDIQQIAKGLLKVLYEASK